jgi:hypothetical protein
MSAAPPADPVPATVEAGALAPWDVADLPEPPQPGWRVWVGLLGPGIVMAGLSIGSGEWLFGPAVTAQYGGGLLWLASISILLQLAANLLIMRYAIYCGEPILVGGLRLWPGPRWWLAWYAVLDVAALFPYNAANAAVPLVAAYLGRLPGDADVALVRQAGVGLFLAAFVPLIFGGTVYRMLEKVMTLKLAYVLSYLTVVSVLMVSGAVWWEVLGGFCRFGTIPIRADKIGTHTGWAGMKMAWVETREEGADLFFVVVNETSKWEPSRLDVTTDKGTVCYDRLDQVPAPYQAHFRELLANRGVQHVNLLTYITTHGHLPPLNWGMIVAFIAIAGLGGLTNTMFSNYARDKGWGMGKHVGAIPSAVGGRRIALSHTGKVFPLDASNRARWLGWMRHIRRDQLIWVLASFIGMALPCLLSLEFIRNVDVAGHQVAALTAEGMARRYPDYHMLFWTLTLFCGFMILFPGQISSGDQIARRWTDLIWSGTRWAQSIAPTKVKYLYYSILALYAAGALAALTLLDPLQIATTGAVLQNIALGFVTLQALYTNRTLLPRELQPGWFLQACGVVCGIFFLSISVALIVLWAQS